MGTIKRWFNSIKYWFSRESCYTEMENRGIAAMGSCCGVVGGDYYSNYLSYSCIDCPHYVNIQN